MESYTTLIWWIIAGGALGGLVSGLVKPSNLQLTLWGGKRMKPGFIGDMVVGLTAAIAVFFLLGAVFIIDISAEATLQDQIKILSLAVIAGFSGNSLLNRLSNNLLGSVSEKVNEMEGKLETINRHQKAKEYLEQGIHLADNGDYTSAITFYNLALTEHPYYSKALCRKAMSLKRLDQVEEALALMEDLLKHDATDASAWYNKACYRLLLGHEKKAVLADLRKSIEQLSWFKTLAKSDPDFTSLKDDTEFIALTR